MTWLAYQKKKKCIHEAGIAREDITGQIVVSELVLVGAPSEGWHKTFDEVVKGTNVGSDASESCQRLNIQMTDVSHYSESHALSTHETMPISMTTLSSQKAAILRCCQKSDYHDTPGTDYSIPSSSAVESFRASKTPNLVL